MKQLQKIASLLAPPALFIVFVLFTDPYKLPLILLTVPFVLFSVASYRFSKLLLGKLGLSKARSKFIAGVITTLLLLLALLQSIRQLSFKDFIILLTLVGGLTWYLRRIDI